MTTFLLTFERITPESAALGDAAERGVLYEAITLREALEHGYRLVRGGWEG